MNVCGGCFLDFGSAAAFDRHRVGTFAYTFAEGLRMDPLREDGRRCLSLDEIRELRDEDGTCVFALNARAAWSARRDLERGRTLRPRSADKASTRKRAA